MQTAHNPSPVVQFVEMAREHYALISRVPTARKFCSGQCQEETLHEQTGGTQQENIYCCTKCRHVLYVRAI